LRWKKLTGSGPVPAGRSSHSVAAVGRKVYIYGGEDVPRNAFDPNFHVYDLDAHTWTELTQVNGEVPHKRVAHATAVVGESIILVAGRYDGEDVNDVWSFNTRTNTWTHHHTTGEEIPTMSYHAATSLGKDVYVFGGCHGHDRLNVVYKLDTEKYHWEKLTTKSDAVPTPRGGPGLVSVAGSVYVYAGYQGKEELDDLWRFDLQSHEWTKIVGQGEAPPARSVHTTNLIGHTIVVYGGECAPSALGHLGAGAYLGDTYLYDIPSNHWTKLDHGDAPGARGWQASASVEASNAVVLSGGFNGEPVRLSDLYILE